MVYFQAGGKVSYTFSIRVVMGYDDYLIVSLDREELWMYTLYDPVS